jgi:NADH dehydrogenase FAD-containing subunit
MSARKKKNVVIVGGGVSAHLLAKELKAKHNVFHVGEMSAREDCYTMTLSQ